MRLDHLLSKEEVGVGYIVQLSGVCVHNGIQTEATKKVPVAMRLRETPVPIPNTMVKT